MGISAFFYAVKGDLDSVESYLREVFPDDVGSLVGRSRSSGSAIESIYRNKDDVELVLWQDGDYVAFAESELCLLEGSLASLSARAGMVIGVCVADQGGCYALSVYKDGDLVRALSSEHSPEGDPIPEEDGVDTESFDDEGVEHIWRAFGLSDFLDGVAPFRVLGHEEA